MTPLSASQWMLQQQSALADDITAAQFKANPGLLERYGPAGRDRCREDARYHLEFLRTALRRDTAALFADYVQWTRALLSGLGIADEDLRENLDRLGQSIAARASTEHWSLIEPILQAGLAVLKNPAQPLQSHIDPEAPLGPEAQRYLNFTLAGERKEAIDLVMACLASGSTVSQLYLNLLTPVQYEIGRLWQLNRLSVADEHYCTAVSQLCASMLFPTISATPRDGRSLAVICATGDLHEFPARMVADLFELDGWKCQFYGASVPLRGLAASLGKSMPDLIAISATMPFHLDNVQSMITQFRNNTALKDCPILVGGLALQSEPELWRDLGANGYARDADSALVLADQLCAQGV